MVLQTDSVMRLCHAAMKQFAPGEVHTTRIYGYSVLILMMRGVLRFRENLQTVELHPGEYYIQRDGLLQEGVPIADTPPVYFYVEFYGGSYAGEGPGLALSGRYEMKQIQPILQAISSAYSRHTANQFLLNSHMFRIFSELMQSAPEYSNTPELLSMVRRYIDAEYATPITLPALSRQFGYQHDYLARLFRRHYHISVYRYLTSVRMEHADWLIQNTDLKISDIAAAVGYRDPSAFYRAFEKYCGTPPRSRGKPAGAHVHGALPGEDEETNRDVSGTTGDLAAGGVCRPPDENQSDQP